MYQVFVSHKTDELPLLEGLVNALNQVGISVYIAERSPWPGNYLYDQKIIPAIATSDCMLVLLTSNSAYSPDVNQEIGIARSHTKPIVALVEKGVQIKGLLGGRPHQESRTKITLNVASGRNVNSAYGVFSKAWCTWGVLDTHY